MTLAKFPRVDARLHRRLPADNELCQAIAVLARGSSGGAIGRKIKTHEDLKSMLQEFFPRFLSTFVSA
jgi:hypothetical protein